MEALCRDCRYWHEIDIQERVGQCRCHAPTMQVEVVRRTDVAFPALWQRGWFPLTNFDEWCGEFEYDRERMKVE